MMDIAVFLGCWSKGFQGNVIEIKYEDAYEYSKKNVVYIATLSIRTPLQKPRKISSINVSYAGRRDRMFEANIRKVILAKIEDSFGIELITRSGGKLLLAKKTFFNEIQPDEINALCAKVVPIREFKREEKEDENEKECNNKLLQKQEQETNKKDESKPSKPKRMKSENSKPELPEGLDY